MFTKYLEVARYCDTPDAWIYGAEDALATNLPARLKKIENVAGLRFSKIVPNERFGHCYSSVRGGLRSLRRGGRRTALRRQASTRTLFFLETRSTGRAVFP